MTTFSEKLAAFAATRNAKGCSDKEIESILSGTGDAVPEAYREFLAVAGRGMDEFLVGSDFTVDELDGVREAADELLAESGLQPLQPTAFVFAMHQGYQFYFFLNREVYFYLEEMDHAEKRFASFEEFFDSVVANLKAKRL